MFSMLYAENKDWPFWHSLDKHLPITVFKRKTAVQECMVIEREGKSAGILRYNFFWDEYPFLNLIFLSPAYRGMGIGRQALQFWEDEMRRQGFLIALTSTMAEEGAQHFYRKLGYQDCGCLLKNIPPLVESMEIFLMKSLSSFPQ